MKDLLEKFKNDTATLADLHDFICQLDLKEMEVGDIDNEYGNQADKCQVMLKIFSTLLEEIHGIGFKEGIETLSKFVKPL